MDEVKSLKRRLTDLRIHMQDVEIIKSKEGYGYNYADLPAILDVLTPILHSHGIGYTHTTEYDKESSNNIVVTEFFNYDNESDILVARTLVDRTVKLGGMNQFMVEGSAITYFRRYHITTVCGLTTDEDTDAGGKKATKQKPGRSVESVHTSTTDVDYIAIFSNLLKNKPKDKVEKTFNTYKPQFSDEQLKDIRNLIDNYENK